MIKFVEVKQIRDFNVMERRASCRFELDEIWINPTSILQIKPDIMMKRNFESGYLPDGLDNRQQFSRINFGTGSNLRQYHEQKDETIFVLAGQLIIEIGPDEDTTITKVEVDVGEAYHITPGTIHRFCASEGVAVELIEVSTPDLQDVVRLEDDYNRIPDAILIGGTSSRCPQCYFWKG